jgi:hypothetical protein
VILSGWASYEGGSFQSYTGTIDSDGTYEAVAYTGITITVGNSMTATYDDGDGTMRWVQTSKAAYKAAGGPVQDGT